MNVTEPASGSFPPRVASWLVLSALALGNAPFPTTTAAPVADGSLPNTATFKQIEAKWSRRPVEELRKAAEAGVPDAQFYFGSTEWKAARRENSLASRWADPAIQMNKVFTEADAAQARARWKDVPEAEVRRAAERGDLEAQFVMGRLESERAFERARQGFAWMKRAAEQSLRIAEEEMAVQYLGLASWAVIPTDVSEGMRWLQRAAAHGSEWAIHKQADFLLSGRFAAPDPAEAIGLLRKALELNCARAAYQLALLFANGDGEPRGPHERPVELLRKSAEAGYHFAIASLAERYRTGLGVERDWIRAIRLYRRADEKDAEFSEWRRTGIRPILETVDDNLEFRRLTNPDIARFAEVLRLYRKATERRDADAMDEIGRLYLRGANVPKDPVESFKWFSEAARRGHAAAAQSREALRASLSPEELQRAQTPLEEFVPVNPSSRPRSTE